MKKSFQNIVIQSKDDRTDFRAFVHCTDAKGAKWELRAYGTTAGEAAEDAWKRYLLDEHWNLYGYELTESP